MNTAELITDNAARWDKMSILPNRLLEVERVSAALVAPNAKAIYQQVQVQVPAVPWWFVAIVHEREASQNLSNKPLIKARAKTSVMPLVLAMEKEACVMVREFRSSVTIAGCPISTPP